MIRRLSVLIVKSLLKHETISKDESDLYVYGTFILISYLFYTIFTLLFGFLFGCVIESLIFNLSFHLIRKYSGGYHANSETRCEVMSLISILICIVLMKISKEYNIQIAILFFTALSAIFIFVLSPLDTPEKPLTAQERLHSRKISRLILFFITIVIIVSLVINNDTILTPSCLSLILESILLIAGKVKRVYLEKKKP